MSLAQRRSVPHWWCRCSGPWLRVALLATLALGLGVASDAATKPITPQAGKPGTQTPQAAVQALWAEGQQVAALQMIAEQRIAACRGLALSTLDHSDAQIVAHGIRALRALGSLTPGELSAIAGCFPSVNQTVRDEALRTIVAANDVSALPAMLRQVEAPDTAIRNQFAMAVRLMVNEGLPADLSEWPAWYLKISEAADIALRAAEPALIGRDPTKAVQAMRGLAAHRFCSSNISARLVPLLRHDDPVIAGAASMTLQALGGPIATAALAASASAAQAAAAPVVSEPANVTATSQRWIVPAACAAVLVIAFIWLGRTPAGRKAAQATVRFVATQAARSPVIRATQRMARQATKRFTRTQPPAINPPPKPAAPAPPSSRA